MPCGIYIRIKPVWNKGLTKETDCRVKKSAKNNSKSHMGYKFQKID